MNIAVSHPKKTFKGTLEITGSKSESNRLLLLQALFPSLKIENISNSDDSRVMKQALFSKDVTVDIHHAGTAMRFLTAYFSIQDKRETILTGSSRMQERPIKILVDALRQLGAKITYENKDGYPPIRIIGGMMSKNRVSLPADVSSQYISALMLIGPFLPHGLVIDLVGEITSIPYIKMTQSLMERIGIGVSFADNSICVDSKQQLESQLQTVESDWSSASYYFSIVALSDQGSIRLKSYREDSLQGDASLRAIYKELGVNSYFEENATLVLSKIPDFNLPKTITLDLTTAPDIAQTIAVSCYGLGIGCDLTGLHTLKIKETDRLYALDVELKKLGANINVTNNSLSLVPGGNFKKNCLIPTYKDHRMAMAFAPLALKIPLEIEEAEVVSKSYPDFWEDLEKIGFELIRR